MAPLGAPLHGVETFRVEIDALTVPVISPSNVATVDVIPAAHSRCELRVCHGVVAQPTSAQPSLLSGCSERETHFLGARLPAAHDARVLFPAQAIRFGLFAVHPAGDDVGLVPRVAVNFEPSPRHRVASVP